MSNVKGLARATMALTVIVVLGIAIFHNFSQRCAVEAQEEPPAGFGGVIHKHPPGCRSFSATDAKYLNPNYEFSLLYIPPAEFPQSLVHIFIKEEWRLQLEGEVKIADLQEEVSKNLIKYHKEVDINEKSQNQRGALRGFLS